MADCCCGAASMIPPDEQTKSETLATRTELHFQSGSLISPAGWIQEMQRIKITHTGSIVAFSNLMTGKPEGSIRCPDAETTIKGEAEEINEQILPHLEEPLGGVLVAWNESLTGGFFSSLLVGAGKIYLTHLEMEENFGGNHQLEFIGSGLEWVMIKEGGG